GATLLPDSGVVLRWIVGSSIYRYPGLTLIVGGRDKGIPLSRETWLLVIARKVGADKADAGAAGTAADRFDLGGVFDTVGCTNIGVVQPGNSVIGVALTDSNVRVALWRLIL